MNSAERRIRPARRDDLPAILRLLADDELGRDRERGLEPAVEAAFVEIEQDPNNTVYVLDDGGEVVGCAQLTLVPGLSRGGAKRALIEAVRVASCRRGQGLGRWFFQELIAIARHQGCRLVQLTSDKRRPEAHRFYASLGFVASHEGFKLWLE